MISSRRVRATATALLVAGLGACDTPTIPADGAAFDPTALTGFLYHWGPGREIAIFVDPTAAPAGTDLPSAVREAIAAWESVARLGELRLRIASSAADADVIVHHAAAPLLVDADGCPPPYAFGEGVTEFCVDGDTPRILTLRDGGGGRVKMDVAINRAAIDDDLHFRAVVLHELGHVLGIGAHSSDPNDVMSVSPRRLTPSARDANTLRWVLGRRATVAF